MATMEHPLLDHRWHVQGAPTVGTPGACLLTTDAGVGGTSHSSLLCTAVTPSAVSAGDARAPGALS